MSSDSECSEDEVHLSRRQEERLLMALDVRCADNAELFRSATNPMLGCFVNRSLAAALQCDPEAPQEEVQITQNTPAQMKKLVLAHNGPLKRVTNIRMMTNLAILNVSYTSVSDEFIRALESLNSLIYLNLEQCKEVCCLEGLPKQNLRFLNLSGCRRIDAENFYFLSKIECLRRVCVSDTLFDDTCLSRLPSTLTHLDILSCRSFSSFAWEKLNESCPVFEELFISAGAFVRFAVMKWKDRVEWDINVVFEAEEREVVGILDEEFESPEAQAAILLQRAEARDELYEKIDSGEMPKAALDGIRTRKANSYGKRPYSDLHSSSSEMIADAEQATNLSVDTKPPVADASEEPSAKLRRTEGETIPPMSSGNASDTLDSTSAPHDELKSDPTGGAETGAQVDRLQSSDRISSNADGDSKRPQSSGAEKPSAPGEKEKVKGDRGEHNRQDHTAVDDDEYEEGQYEEGENEEGDYDSLDDYVVLDDDELADADVSEVAHHNSVRMYESITVPDADTSQPLAAENDNSEPSEELTLITEDVSTPFGQPAARMENRWIPLRLKPMSEFQKRCTIADAKDIFEAFLMRWYSSQRKDLRVDSLSRTVMSISGLGGCFRLAVGQSFTTAFKNVKVGTGGSLKKMGAFFKCLTNIFDVCGSDLVRLTEQRFYELQRYELNPPPNSDTVCINCGHIDGVSSLIPDASKQLLMAPVLDINVLNGIHTFVPYSPPPLSHWANGSPPKDHEARRIVIAVLMGWIASRDRKTSLVTVKDAQTGEGVQMRAVRISTIGQTFQIVTGWKWNDAMKGVIGNLKNLFSAGGGTYSTY